MIGAGFIWPSRDALGRPKETHLSKDNGMALATGWGRYPKQETEIKEPRTIEQLREIVLSDTRKIARGAGRAYSDSAIGLSTTISTKHLNQFESFDAKSGQLVAGAGVTLADILEAMVPRGWFLGVTPGTKYVTLGGAIAADVHGKNHHRDGSFRTTVLWVELMGADGTIARCSATENPDLFDRTLKTYPRHIQWHGSIV